MTHTEPNLGHCAQITLAVFFNITPSDSQHLQKIIYIIYRSLNVNEEMEILDLWSKHASWILDVVFYDWFKKLDLHKDDNLLRVHMHINMLRVFTKKIVVWRYFCHCIFVLKVIPWSPNLRVNTQCLYHSISIS